MRRTKTITIRDDGRDFGKSFLITELPAHQAEKWAARALLAMAKSGVDLPDSIGNAGFAGVAAIGLRALVGVAFHEAEPLMDEMFACIQFVPDPARPNIPPRSLISEDIEEVRTRLALRMEVLELHTGFSLAALLSPSTVDAATMDGDTPAP